MHNTIKQWQLPLFSSKTKNLKIKQVCVQLPASADNEALPAFGHWTQLMLSIGSVAINCDLWPTGSTAATPQQQHVEAARDKQTDGQTPDSCIDPALHTMQAMQIITCRLTNRTDNSHHTHTHV